LRVRSRLRCVRLVCYIWVWLLPGYYARLLRTVVVVGHVVGYVDLRLLFTDTLLLRYVLLVVRLLRLRCYGCYAHGCCCWLVCPVVVAFRWLRLYFTLPCGCCLWLFGLHVALRFVVVDYGCWLLLRYALYVALYVTFTHVYVYVTLTFTGLVTFRFVTTLLLDALVGCCCTLLPHGLLLRLDVVCCVVTFTLLLVAFTVVVTLDTLLRCFVVALLLFGTRTVVDLLLVVDLPRCCCCCLRCLVTFTLCCWLLLRVYVVTLLLTFDCSYGFTLRLPFYVVDTLLLRRLLLLRVVTLYVVVVCGCVRYVGYVAFTRTLLLLVVVVLLLLLLLDVDYLGVVTLRLFTVYG